MGMPFELNTMIVTKGKEIRLDDDRFSLKKEGYRLYPVDIPIEVRKTINSKSSGVAIIETLVLEKSHTSITYKYITINSTN